MNIPKRTRTWIGMSPTGDLGPFTIYTSRRAGTVWFLKAPPTSPPTVHQLRQRNRFRLAAIAWRNLSQETRNDWNLAAVRAALTIHGYDLWIWWQLRRDRSTLATIERHSRIDLLPA